MVIVGNWVVVGTGPRPVEPRSFHDREVDIPEQFLTVPALGPVEQPSRAANAQLRWLFPQRSKEWSATGLHRSDGCAITRAGDHSATTLASSTWTLRTEQ